MPLPITPPLSYNVVLSLSDMSGTLIAPWFNTGQSKALMDLLSAYTLNVVYPVIDSIPPPTDNSPTDKELTYNLDGTLNTVTDSYGSKTMVYSGGRLSQITGTGSYPSKAFTYDINGKLTDITIL